jgi:hypothetical protein
MAFLNETLDFFLRAGKQSGTQHWARADACPREIVWETRASRGVGKEQERRDKIEACRAMLLDV